jgi:two-component system sensor histidine kinase HydH
VGAESRRRPFSLLRWFSIVSLAALLPVAAITGSILSHFITNEALQRDALLTAEFIQNCLEVEAAQLGSVTSVQLFDPQFDSAAAGIKAEAMARARMEVFEHLGTLPDTLLTSLYARDGRIIWSTSPGLIGTYPRDNAELRKAFTSRVDVTKRRAGNRPDRSDQRFPVEPVSMFTDNYVPLRNAQGEVAMVVEVYKEPRHLMASVRTGQWLVWCTTLAGGAVIYFGLFGIIRRASTLLAQQQHQLIEAESQVFVGEMATALAHSLRNPLASVRSSAELASMADEPSVRKNAQDIMTQVDFLSHWIRELLLYSRPMTAETEAIDLGAVLSNVLASFAPAFERDGIRLVWAPEESGGPFVEGNASLITQALHSVISNAVEAMPAGGEMRVEIRRSREPPSVELSISDTGVGMSKQQLATAFKPFHTTKAHGLGVGLPMIKRAMERFGGFVTLSSAENAGTQVRLHFKT